MGLTQGASATALPSTLTNETDRVHDRLTAVLERVINVGNAVHGPRPRDASADGKNPAPPAANSLRRFTMKAHDVISAIEEELSHIEGNL